MFGWANYLSYAVIKIQDLLPQVHRSKYYTIVLLRNWRGWNKPNEMSYNLCGFKIIFHNIVVAGNVIQNDSDFK